ncbi:hypothetical protein X798_01910 [Onchocerca flexuosa]|uniref:Uncharacterized protein n=1 Tax=Onchocerca flexuosa TaxID=387005 RepID=A0A238C136_9BILA|nr:hypothetical protein X798_01910 [Onchocerca flexuosa]
MTSQPKNVLSGDPKKPWIQSGVEYDAQKKRKKQKQHRSLKEIITSKGKLMNSTLSKQPAHISYCDLAKKFFEVNKMISIHKKWKNNPLKETANDTCYIKSTEEKILTNEDVEFVIDFFLRTPWFK